MRRFSWRAQERLVNWGMFLACENTHVEQIGIEDEKEPGICLLAPEMSSHFIFVSCQWYFGGFLHASITMLETTWSPALVVSQRVTPASKQTFHNISVSIPPAGPSLGRALAIVSTSFTPSLLPLNLAAPAREGGASGCQHCRYHSRLASAARIPITISIFAPVGRTRRATPSLV